MANADPHAARLLQVNVGTARELELHGKKIRTAIWKQRINGPVTGWGPQYIADAFANELAWLGITHSHSCVREAQCNGVIERFIRTLKEPCLWLHRFERLDEARRIIDAFIERYNHQWLIERLDHRTPAVARQELLAGLT